MKLKALTFDIIGTVFDYRDGLAQGVGSLDTKYGLNVQGPAFASGSIAGYANGVAAPGWTPPDTILQNVTASLLPIPQLGPKAAQAIQDFFNLWRALPPWPDVAAGMQALHKSLHPGRAVQHEHCDPDGIARPRRSAIRRLALG